MAKKKKKKNQRILMLSRQRLRIFTLRTAPENWKRTLIKTKTLKTRFKNHVVWMLTFLQRAELFNNFFVVYFCNAKQTSLPWMKLPSSTCRSQPYQLANKLVLNCGHGVGVDPRDLDTELGHAHTHPLFYRLMMVFFSQFIAFIICLGWYWFS